MTANFEMHRKICLRLLTFGVWPCQQISTSHYPSSGSWATCLEQSSSLTLTVWYAICREIYKRRLISRDGNSDYQMGLIPDPSQTSLPEFIRQGKIKSCVKMEFFYPLHWDGHLVAVLDSLLYFAQCLSIYLKLFIQQNQLKTIQIESLSSDLICIVLTWFCWINSLWYIDKRGP